MGPDHGHPLDLGPKLRCPAVCPADRQVRRVNCRCSRNVVERCFNRLKQFRAIATRFDKLAVRYQSGLHLASLILWLRDTTA